MSSSPIVEVCVYRQETCRPCRSNDHGAELTRHVKYTPQSTGPQTIKVPIEQDDVDMSTVKVESPDSTLAVLDIGLSSKPESYEDKIGRFERATSLYARLKELTRQKAGLQLTLQRLRTLEEHLKALPEECRRLELRGDQRCATPPTDPGSTYLRTLESLLNTSPDSHVKLCNESFQAIKDLEKVEAELQKCQRELYDLCSAGLRLPNQIKVGEREADWRQKYEDILTTFSSRKQTIERHEIVVSADMPELKPVELKIRYSTRGGHWNAAYDLKIKSDDLSTLEVFYYARIQQNSSEDWKDVDLTISTGKMSTAGAPPSLGVYVVRPEAPKLMARNVMALRKRKMPGKTTGLFGVAAPMAMMRGADDDDMGFAMDSAMAPPVEMLTAAPLEGASTQAAYKIGQKVTVIADAASPSQFLISKVQLPMKTIFYCAPEVDTNVYRASRLTNASDYYLVESNTSSVFWDGSYIASAKMPCVAPGDAFNLFLGQTEKVQIKVNPPKHWIKNGGGLMAQKDRLFYERTVTVSNYESASIMMFLAFNLIESQDEEIKVSLEKINNVLEISAPDDITIVTSPKFPTSVKRLQWIYNPVTRNCIALLVVEPKGQELVTFATVIDSPNGRVISIKPIQN